MVFGPLDPVYVEEASWYFSWLSEGLLTSDTYKSPFPATSSIAEG